MAGSGYENQRKRVERELAEVRRAAEALKNAQRAQELEGLGDNTPLSEEIDSALAGEQRELASDRLQRLLDRAAALDDALHRIDRGDYGTCIACGGRISRERLEALPEAARCVRCEESDESAIHREIHAHEWKRVEEVFRERRSLQEDAPPRKSPRPDDA